MKVHGYKKQRNWVRAVRGRLLPLLLPTLAVALSGCIHRKSRPVVLPQSQSPVTLATAPDPENPPLVETPAVVVPPVPTAAAASKPKRERRRPAPKSTPPPAGPPTQVAAAEGLPDDSGIGELTAGGDANPQRRQVAADLIESNEKRLKALPAEMAKAQRSQISKIRNFQRKAQQALNSGDVEGATTLATKAKLLLYDLDRGAGISD